MGVIAILLSKQIHKNFFFFIPIGILSLLSSCLSAYYTPVMQGVDAVYQPKPMQSDSVKSNTYLKAVLGYGGADNLNDSQQFFELSYSKAYAFNKFNFSYGMSACFGDYHNGFLDPSDVHYFTSKGFSVVGLSTTANFVSVSGRTEYRFPGIALSMSKEFGHFAKFRKEIVSEPSFYTNPNTFLVSVAGTAEIIWHHKKNIQNQYGICLLLGRTLANNRMIGFEESIYAPEKSFIFSMNYFLKFDQLSIILEQSYSAGRIGFIYSFN